MKRLYIVIFIVVVIFLITSCGASTKQKSVNPVQEYTVQRGAIMESVDVSGFLVAKDDKTIKSYVSGVVKKVYVQEGDEVKRGDLIAELEDDEYRLSYEKAKKAYEEALISGSESDISIKKLELNIAKKKLDEAKIYAPFDGIIADVFVSDGDIVGNGAKIARVVSKKVYVQAAVDEIDYGKIKVGSNAIVSFEALPQSKAFGRVSFISPVAQNSGGLVVFPIKVEIERGKNIDKAAPGMSCDLSIVIAKLENVLKIPSDALIFNKGKYFVKVKNGEKVEEREVKVGYVGDFFAQVLSGLKEGDVIVIERQSAIKKTPNLQGLMRRIPRK